MTPRAVDTCVATHPHPSRPDQPARLGNGEQQAGSDVSNAQPLDGERDEISVERELHGGIRHRRQRKPGERRLAAHEADGSAPVEPLRRSAGEAVVACAQREKDGGGGERQSNDHGISRPRGGERDRRQHQRTRHGADLVAGLSHGEDQRPLLGTRQPRQQRRAGRRLRPEGEADDDAGHEQGRERAEAGDSHGDRDGQRAQRRHHEGAEPRREQPAVERRGGSDREARRGEQTDGALAVSQLRPQHARREQGQRARAPAAPSWPPAPAGAGARKCCLPHAAPAISSARNREG